MTQVSTQVIAPSVSSCLRSTPVFGLISSRLDHDHDCGCVCEYGTLASASASTSGSGSAPAAAAPSPSQSFGGGGGGGERERERNQFDDARQLNGGLNKEHINVPEKNLSKKYMHDGKKASAEASTGEEGTRTGAEAAQGL